MSSSSSLEFDSFDFDSQELARIEGLANESDSESSQGLFISLPDSQGDPGISLTRSDIDILDQLEAEALRAADTSTDTVTLPDAGAARLKEPRLSATNLAVYHHMSCERYLYLSYHSTPAAGHGQTSSEIVNAQFHKGIQWEEDLFHFLEAQNRLELIPAKRGLLSGVELAQVFFQASARSEVFVAGVEFAPPSFATSFAESGACPVKFGIAKPDLVRLQRSRDDEGQDTITWEVCDAKASEEVKTSHHVQIGFYHLCLTELLPSTIFGVRLLPSTVATVWLPQYPPTAPRPLLISLLLEPLRAFLFRRLPAMVHAQEKDVKWHFNPLCQSCNFRHRCERDTVSAGLLGNIPNLSLADASAAQTLLTATKKDDDVTDIEDLHQLLADSQRFRHLERTKPSATRMLRRILALPQGLSSAACAYGAFSSPVLDAVRKQKPQVTRARTFSFPLNEDIAVLVSLALDASQRISAFRIDVMSSSDVWGYTAPEFDQDLLSQLAKVIRHIRKFKDTNDGAPTLQFYTFSTAERNALVQFLLDSALRVDDSSDAESLQNVRLCIGALCEGAAVVATMFQPSILSGSMLEFLAKGTALKKKDLQECLKRLNLDGTGTAEDLRARLSGHLANLKELAGRAGAAHNLELGCLPRIVVVKQEIERLIAIPHPGFWNLREAVHALVGAAVSAPTDDEISAAITQGATIVQSILRKRNKAIKLLVSSVRRHIGAYTTQPSSILLNDARPLRSAFIDLCRHPVLRKLFYMQQFEVLSRLQALWNMRRDGCPDAPLVRYVAPRQKGHDLMHCFEVLQGSVETPTAGDFGMFGWILTEDGATDARGVPLENLFDDLVVCGMVFPLFSRQRWRLLDQAVQDRIAVANIAELSIEDDLSHVSLELYAGAAHRLTPGTTYRISPRLVDFNFVKVLRTLVELDLDTGLQVPPFVELLQDPERFSQDVETTFGGSAYLKAETSIHNTLRMLRSLDNEHAGALVLKDSQRRATRRMFRARLTIIWGPPGTGKTYTLACSLLRMIEAAHRADGFSAKRVIFVTAFTNAACQALAEKIDYLKCCYRAIPDYPLQWLNDVAVEQVKQGSSHAKSRLKSVEIYIGTSFQLHNLAKKHRLYCDCVLMDEAGQMSLTIACLTLRWLKPYCKIVLAGDHLQLGTILDGQYPATDPPLFGSILDFLVPPAQPSVARSGSFVSADISSESSQHQALVQITENFRLNPDLAAFVETIYLRRFKPMKLPLRQTGEALRRLAVTHGSSDPVLGALRTFLVALGEVMLGRRPDSLTPPKHAFVASSEVLDHRSASLALIKLNVLDSTQSASYEAHVRAEARVAACLVSLLRASFPNARVFVATPHRVQRQAVKAALAAECVDDLAQTFERITIQEQPTSVVTVDTVERLQGSEADFVLCLFAHSHRATLSEDLPFLLSRRRINVAISRAKTLCIVISSQGVLRPSVQILANQDAAQGFAYLRAFEERAWSATVAVDAT